MAIPEMTHTTLRDEALATVEAHADTSWRALAVATIRRLADAGPFTADDVWEALRASGAATHEPRALGALIINTARAGLIVGTGRYFPSRLPQRHARPVKEWVKA